MAKSRRIGLLQRHRIREAVLFLLITLTAIAANLPHGWVEEGLGIDQNALVGVLLLLVVIGLFLYLKFFAFLAEALLIAGANLPEQIANSFGISKMPLLLALVAMVGVSLVNYVVRIVPTGLEAQPRKQSADALRAMMKAIGTGNLLDLRKLLLLNYSASSQDENGRTPLGAAAAKGNLKMVELLLRHGADPRQTDRGGDTPIELALRAGHGEVADHLRQVRAAMEEGAGADGRTRAPD